MRCNLLTSNCHGGLCCCRILFLRQNGRENILNILARCGNRTRARARNGQNTNGSSVRQVIGKVNILGAVVSIHRSPHRAIVDIGSVRILAIGNQRFDNKDVIFLSSNASRSQNASNDIVVTFALCLHAFIMGSACSTDSLQVLISGNAITNLESAKLQVKARLTSGRYSVFVSKPICRCVTPNLNLGFHRSIGHNFPPSKYFCRMVSLDTVRSAAINHFDIANANVACINGRQFPVSRNDIRNPIRTVMH